MTAVIAAIFLGPVALSDTSRFAYATSTSFYPNTGAPGDLISYSIARATASTPYNMTFDTTTIASGTTDSTGAASGTFTIPAGAIAGPHNITFNDGITIDKQIIPFQVLSSSSTSSSTVTSSVTIAGTCGLSFGPKGGSIDYGKLIPGSGSAPQQLVLDNTGTATATLLAFGSNWLDGNGNNQINVGNTKWSLTPGPPFTGLTSTPATLTSNFASGNLQTYWQLVANLNNSTFTGTLTQSIGLSVSC